VPPTFNTPSQGAFDPKYMAALYQTGYQIGQSATPFGSQPPPYPAPPAEQPSSESVGVNR
jgi:hypothetical protein